MAGARMLEPCSWGTISSCTAYVRKKCGNGSGDHYHRHTAYQTRQLEQIGLIIKIRKKHLFLLWYMERTVGAQTFSSDILFNTMLYGRNLSRAPSPRTWSYTKR